MSDVSLLTGPPLAEALYKAGLAPADITTTHHGYLVSRQPHMNAWRPWDQIQDVWHLVLAFSIEITPVIVRGIVAEWMVIPHQPYPVEALSSADTTDIPMLIGNVALWCHAQQEVT